MKKTILVLGFLMFFVSSAFGAVICATNDSTDTDCTDGVCWLDSALDLAEANGEDDVILIRQGTYYANEYSGFDYSSNQGYSLTLKGGYDATFQNQTLSPQNTILDGGDLYGVLNLQYYNGGDVYVEGLTIQNSHWWNLSGFNVVTQDPAQGEVASITIYKNIIRNNKTGGLYVAANDFLGGVGELQTGTIIIRENTIYNNPEQCVKAVTLSNNGIASDISLIDNTITDNIRLSGWPVNTVEIYGGSATGNIIAQGNYIAGNSNPGGQGGGLKVEINPGTGTAGAIYLENNTIVGNDANDGGGLYVEAEASYTAGISGAEVYLINNIIADNTATNQGGAIRLPASNSVIPGDEGARYLINNTITGNDGNKWQCDGALLGRRADSVYHLYNNIIWGNAETSSDYDVYFLGAAASGTLNIYNNDYSYLYQDGSGTVNTGGNLNAAPVFAGGEDYHLTLGSPCIDTGTNAAPALPLKDKDGRPRIIDGDGNHIAVADMGAYEFTPVSLVCIPDSTVVPRGGILGFQVTVDNNTNEVQMVGFATNITLPNGVIFPPSGFLFGPIPIFLNPHQSISGHLSLPIPIYAPLGTYTYHSYIGKPGEGIIEENQFDFEVIQGSAIEGPEDWETTVDQSFSE
jgi:hypothetical protein